jgi:DHA1 family tetracycline resistance protein-like MFS transporter
VDKESSLQSWGRDEALRRLWGPAQRRAQTVLFLVVFVDLLGFGLVIPLLPVYAAELHATDLTIGLLMACFSGMQFLFAPVWGRISDRVGRRPILLLGLVGSTSCYSLLGYATSTASLELLFVARVLGGLFGATIPTAQAYVADVTPPEERGAGMALLGAAFGLGFTFGPLLGALALTAGGQPSVSGLPGYMAAGFSAAALALGLLWLPEPPARRGQAAGQHQKPRPGRWTRALTAHRSIPFLVAGSFWATLSFATFETTLSRYGRELFAFSAQQLLYLFVAIGLTLAVAQLGLVRPLLRRLGEQTALSIGCLLLASGLTALALAASVGSPLLLTLPLPWVVVGYATLPPSLQGLLSQRTDPQLQATTLGLGQSAAALGRIVGPIVGNLLYGLSAQHNLPYYGGALAALLLLVMASSAYRD